MLFFVLLKVNYTILSDNKFNIILFILNISNAVNFEGWVYILKLAYQKLVKRSFIDDGNIVDYRQIRENK
jgi:hypothetical protein